MEDLVIMSKESYDKENLERYRIQQMVEIQSRTIDSLLKNLSEQRELIMNFEADDYKLENYSKEKCMDLESFYSPFYKDSFTRSNFDKKVILNYISRKWDEVHKKDKNGENESENENESE